MCLNFAQDDIYGKENTSLMSFCKSYLYFPSTFLILSYSSLDFAWNNHGKSSCSHCIS